MTKAKAKKTDKGVAKLIIHMISKGVPGVNKLGVTILSQSSHQVVKKWSPNYYHVVTKWSPSGSGLGTK